MLEKSFELSDTKSEIIVQSSTKGANGKRLQSVMDSSLEEEVESFSEIILKMFWAQTFTTSFTNSYVAVHMSPLDILSPLTATFIFLSLMLLTTLREITYVFVLSWHNT